MNLICEIIFQMFEGRKFKAPSLLLLVGTATAAPFQRDHLAMFAVETRIRTLLAINIHFDGI